MLELVQGVRHVKAEFEVCELRGHGSDAQSFEVDVARLAAGLETGKERNLVSNFAGGRRSFEDERLGRVFGV